MFTGSKCCFYVFLIATSSLLRVTTNAPEGVEGYKYTKHTHMHTTPPFLDYTEQPYSHPSPVAANEGKKKKQDKKKELFSGLGRRGSGKWETACAVLYKCLSLYEAQLKETPDWLSAIR